MENITYGFLINLTTVMVVLLVNSLIWQLLGRVSLLSTAALLIAQAVITWVVLSSRTKRKRRSEPAEM